MTPEKPNRTGAQRSGRRNPSQYPPQRPEFRSPNRDLRHGLPPPRRRRHRSAPSGVCRRPEDAGDGDHREGRCSPAAAPSAPTRSRPARPRSHTTELSSIRAPSTTAAMTTTSRSRLAKAATTTYVSPDACLGGKRSGFRMTGFEACSAFTRVAACTLTEPPTAALLVGVLQTISLPPSPALAATGWSDSFRAGFAPAEEWSLYTAHYYYSPNNNAQHMETKSNPSLFVSIAPHRLKRTPFSSGLSSGQENCTRSR